MKLLRTIALIGALIVFGIMNQVGIERAGKYAFYRTAAFVSPFIRDQWTVSLSVPMHRQERALSCEIAALKMALGYYNVDVSEQELVDMLPFDTKGPREEGNIWGDPQKGFVGDIDGKIPDGGYGVYEQPIAVIASSFRKAKVLENATIRDVAMEINSFHPVIVWGSLASGKDISWKTKDGQTIKAVFGEHARVAIGFSGTIENPKTIILLDPVYGKIYMSAKAFQKNWALLDNKAVVVY